MMCNFKRGKSLWFPRLFPYPFCTQLEPCLAPFRKWRGNTQQINAGGGLPSQNIDWLHRHLMLVPYPHIPDLLPSHFTKIRVAKRASQRAFVKLCIGLICSFGAHGLVQPDGNLTATYRLRGGFGSIRGYFPYSQMLRPEPLGPLTVLPRYM